MTTHSELIGADTPLKRLSPALAPDDRPKWAQARPERPLGPRVGLTWALGRWSAQMIGLGRLRIFDRNSAPTPIGQC